MNQLGAAPAFCFDNNLSPQLVAGMRAFGESAIHLSEIFPKDPKDVAWLPEIGKRGLFLITRDDHIRHRPAELQAYKSHSVGGFVLGGKNRSHCDLIRQVVRNWHLMKEVAHKTRRPFLFRVPPSGGRLDPISL